MSVGFEKILSRAVIGISALLCTSAASAQDLQVDINRTQVLYLPVMASAVVIGNPEIADVSVHSADTLFVVGRGFGETNLIVLDQSGQKIMDKTVTVKNVRGPSSVRIHNIGSGNQTYSCTPYCAPAPVLSDNPSFVGTFSGRGAPINNVAATGPVTSTPPSASISGLSGFQPQSQPRPDYSNMSSAQAKYMARNAEN